MFATEIRGQHSTRERLTVQHDPTDRRSSHIDVQKRVAPWHAEKLHAIHTLGQSGMESQPLRQKLES